MPNNDLISRAAAIAEVEQWAEHGYDVIHWTGIKAMLETQPAVDAAPIVHAQWIEEPDRYYHWRCSACGFVEGVVSKFYHYCPDCGAKMDDLSSTCGPDYCEIGGGDDADG